jgi:hypothetical protein
VAYPARRPIDRRVAAHPGSRGPTDESHADNAAIKID